MSKYNEKLAELPATIRTVYDANCDNLERKVRSSLEKSAIAVGSGGSVVSAEYFSRCREMLGSGPTIVSTPLELTIDSHNLNDVEVWIFSARAKSPDTLAAIRSAKLRGCGNIILVTTRNDLTKKPEIARENITICDVPSVDSKDGFLASHSLISTIISLFIASNNILNECSNEKEEYFLEEAKKILSNYHNSDEIEFFSKVKREDTIILLTDPLLKSIGVLFEISNWEASLCNVQSTDIRNFAHGRHTWLRNRPDNSILVALTGPLTHGLYKSFSSFLPTMARKICFNFENCGLMQNALGILKCMVWISKLGISVGIDPATPGVSDFGRNLYVDDSLANLSKVLDPAIRHKFSAIQSQETKPIELNEICSAYDSFVSKLTETEVYGIVLDYDGTIVPEGEKRFCLPKPEFVKEFQRLWKVGITIAIATGRGGSVGEKLRAVVPKEMQNDIWIGYYNGWLIRELSIDISKSTRETDPKITRTVDWLKETKLIESKNGIRENPNQISIDFTKILDQRKLFGELENFEYIKDGYVKTFRSEHSLDVVLSETSKRSVVDMLVKEVNGDKKVVCIGDQGSENGNDYELLNSPFGISVNKVSSSLSSCWSIFGENIKGPNATLKILKSIHPDASGKIRFHLKDLRSCYPQPSNRMELS